MTNPAIHPSGADLIRIHPPEFRERGEWVRVAFPVEGLAHPELWFDVSAEQRHLLSNTCDPALTSLLATAMAAGKTLRVDGPVSARLLWHLRNTVPPVVTRMRPFLRAIPIEASDPRHQWEERGTGVLTGFSCGVDSLSAIQDHLLDETVPPSDRITHLIFASLGNHGYGPDTERRIAQRWERIREGAERLGLPVFRVYSNLPKFYPDQHDSPLSWLSTMTPRASAAPLLLQNGIRRFLFASSHRWADIRVLESRDMSKADPILLPALSTERTELCSVGTEYTRVEKTGRIAEWKLAQEFLDVCIMEGERNCSSCEKCLRTLLTLDLHGSLEAFKDRFDLAEYARHRDEFIARVLTERTMSLHLEIRDFMVCKGFRPPPKARALALALRTWRLVPHGLRKTIRGTREGR